MALLLLAYIAGILTILSPCILPVLPFIFTRVEKPFRAHGLLLLGGMASTFTLLAALAAYGGGFATAFSQWGRLAALGFLALFAITLLSERFSYFIHRPLVRIGERLSRASQRRLSKSQALASLSLGVAAGFLWAPCAGPILGLILTSAALNGASFATSALLLAYALGAATSLALALLGGGKILTYLKKSFGIGIWVRRGLGAATLASAGLIASGSDSTFFAKISFVDTAHLEEGLINSLAGDKAPGGENARGVDQTFSGDNAVERQNLSWTGDSQAHRRGLTGAIFKPDTTKADIADLVTQINVSTSSSLPVEGALPGFAGATEWLNSGPLSPASLRGKVVLVNFWTFGCYNCLNALPYVRAWAQKYKDHGLVVIGVHTPELAFERDPNNVRNALGRLKVTYPVAIDNSYTIWKAFSNQYWPALYFADAQGEIRHHHFGEHDYENSERVIQRLLEEAGNRNVPGGFVTASNREP